VEDTFYFFFPQLFLHVKISVLQTLHEAAMSYFALMLLIYWAHKM